MVTRRAAERLEKRKDIAVKEIQNAEMCLGLADKETTSKGYLSFMLLADGHYQNAHDLVGSMADPIFSEKVSRAIREVING